MKLIFIILSSLLFLLSCSSIKSSKEVTISKNDTHVMINVLHPKEGVNQKKLLDALIEGIDKDISAIEGFISATIHASKDSNHVSVYAQWRDKASVGRAIRKIQSGNASFMEKAFTISKPNFHAYKIVKIISAETI